MKLKYIIIDGVFPIIFTEAQTHKSVALGFAVTSAGFVSVRSREGKIKAHAYGNSISLNKKCERGDSEILTKALNSP